MVLYDIKLLIDILIENTPGTSLSSMILTHAHEQICGETTP